MLAISGCSAEAGNRPTASPTTATPSRTSSPPLTAEQLTALAFKEGEVPQAKSVAVQEPRPESQKTTFPPVSDASCQRAIDVLRAKTSAAHVIQIFSWKKDGRGGRIHTRLLRGHEGAGGIPPAPGRTQDLHVLYRGRMDRKVQHQDHGGEGPRRGRRSTQLSHDHTSAGLGRPVPAPRLRPGRRHHGTLQRSERGPEDAVPGRPGQTAGRPLERRPAPLTGQHTRTSHLPGRAADPAAPGCPLPWRSRAGMCAGERPVPGQGLQAASRRGCSGMPRWAVSPPDPVVPGIKAPWCGGPARRPRPRLRPVRPDSPQPGLGRLE
ncbi:hypothetical protein SSCG_02210 [Streptomyces clavuligerus]|nr:hypothetical protein SSCG_02210 [Streptomyces clavuligerus]